MGGEVPENYYFDLLATAKENPIANYIFENQGEYTFKNKAIEWGLTDKTYSNGAAYADLDNDGDLDIVINNLDQPCMLYKNNNQGNNYIKIKPVRGLKDAPALNAKVTLYTGNQKQFIEVKSTRGYQSSMEPIAFFGLGNHEKIDRVEIEWLDKTKTVIQSPKVNQTLLVYKVKSQKTKTPQKTYSTYFTDLSQRLNSLDFIHRENDFDDFAKEVLLPHKMSTPGPFVTVEDVNKDGHYDLFVGGAMGQSGELYIQDGEANFTKLTNQPWHKHRQFEDTGVLFFDADGDTDFDLYVASGGGGDVEGKNRILQDRLYINEGNGRFSDGTSRLPKMAISSGRVRTADYDRDGDYDLIVAGRCIPGKYPHPASSYLLENKNGKFVDVTSDVIPGFKELGMVMDLNFCDFDNDKAVDIIAVGEWMPITFFKNENGKFVDVTGSATFQNESGWWRSISTGDFDKDGDLDFIIGNVGKNNKFHPSSGKALHVYCNDFDDNGSLDIVLSSLYKGKKVPVRGKECSTAQMPFVSEKFPLYKDFANASLSEIYTQDKLDEALHYKVTNFHSIYLENKGNLEFTVHDLPQEVQMAPVNAAVVRDFTGDGHLDVVLAGNMFESEVETPSYDGGKGLFLIGDGKGGFSTTNDIGVDGIFAGGNVKDLALIPIGPGKVPSILVANNNDRLQLFGYLKK